MHSFLTKAPPWILVALAAIGAFYLMGDWWNHRESIEGLSRIVGKQQHLVETLSNLFEEHVLTERSTATDVDKRLRDVERRIEVLNDRWDRLGYHTEEEAPAEG